VRSVSVVPVGLTGHRTGLAPVRAFTREEARDVLSTVRRWGRGFRRTLGSSFCFAADEFVLLAGRPVPPASYYEDFEQRENGVGLVRFALIRFREGIPADDALAAAGVRRVLCLTGESFGPVLQAALPALARRLPRVVLEAVTVENRLFGRPTTVAGLLGGRDLLEAARRRVRPGDLVLVPDEAVNGDGVFLDDLRPQDLSRELGVPVAASWDSLLADPDLPGDPSEEPAPALAAVAP
jgi:NifB/MoaA-like Fe-S oxidoreductase